MGICSKCDTVTLSEPVTGCMQDKQGPHRMLITWSVVHEAFLSLTSYLMTKLHDGILETGSRLL